MAATKKQLAALAKGRRTLARKRKEAKAKARAKAPAKRKTTARKKVAPKRTARKNPVIKGRQLTNYAVAVTTTKGDGWLSNWTTKGPEFDTDVHKALTFPGARMATKMQNAVYSLAMARKLPRIKTVNIKIVGHVPTKKR
jgi:hypothetical protein